MSKKLSLPKSFRTCFVHLSKPLGLTTAFTLHATAPMRGWNLVSPPVCFLFLVCRRPSKGLRPKLLGHIPRRLPHSSSAPAFSLDLSANRCTPATKHQPLPTGHHLCFSHGETCP
eukprot:5223415-Amphidinium_carterae.1